VQDNEQAKTPESVTWKSHDGGVDVPPDHPSGQIRLPLLASVGARTTALAGVLMGVGFSAAVALHPLMCPPSSPTVSVH
jgi:hypothetical protein